MPVRFQEPSLLVRVGIILGLVGALAACGGVAAVRQPGPPICPATYIDRAPVEASRDGDLVPEGGSSALLCVYSFPRTGTQYPLHQSIPLAADKVNKVVDYLNTLDPPDGENNACMLAGHDEYQIILGYPDNTNVIVRINWNCGNVSADGAVRQANGMKTLLGFWPEPTSRDRWIPAQTPTAHR